MTSKILITGGCGFIGSSLAHSLLKNGFSVKIIDNLSAGKKAYIKECLLENKRCEFAEGSITSFPFLRKELQSVDVVIHEAANPDVRSSTTNLFRDFETNVLGTVNVLEAMVQNQIPKIIFASSAGTVYGEAAVMPTPETHALNPISHYGASKAACEQYMSSFSSLYNIEAITLRLGNIFGPPSDHGVVYDFYRKLKANPTTLEILGNGQQVKSYLYIDDCLAAHLQALQQTFTGHKIFNIANTEGIIVKAVADEVVASLGLKRVTYTYTGGKGGWAGDVPRAIPDISKAKKELKWHPQISIKEGIRRYIQWLEKQS